MYSLKNGSDSPRIYIPPPVVFVAVFFLSYVFQSKCPLDISFLHTELARSIGILMAVIGSFFFVPAIYRFMRTGNAIMPVSPARSLQMIGPYSLSRNPMYTGLLLIYTGLAVLHGNCWTFILIPVLILIVQEFIIKKEEAYLQRAFGRRYEAYRRKVRRWL
jgi:protein-S-isoprenylcysteine O-methyltransferase Ste14